MYKITVYHITWGLAVILILAGGALVFFPSVKEENTISGGSGANISTTSDASDIPTDISDFNAAVALALPDIPIPDLDSPPIIAEDIPKELQDSLREKIANLSAALKEDPSLFGSWLDLGIQKKTAGDYEGARLAWEYARALSPESFVPYSNLGDLYHYYVKDYRKAEFNLLEAIARSKKNSAVYISLHELYKYSYEEKASQADDILLQGLAEIPNNIDLLTTLGLHYLGEGDNETARIYYERAKEEAEKIGDTERAARIEAELKDLQE